MLIQNSHSFFLHQYTKKSHLCVMYQTEIWNIITYYLNSLQLPKSYCNMTCLLHSNITKSYLLSDSKLSLTTSTKLYSPLLKVNNNCSFWIVWLLPYVEKERLLVVESNNSRLFLTVLKVWDLLSKDIYCMYQGS